MLISLTYIWINLKLYIRLDSTGYLNAQQSRKIYVYTQCFFLHMAIIIKKEKKIVLENRVKG